MDEMANCCHGHQDEEDPRRLRNQRSSRRNKRDRSAVPITSIKVKQRSTRKVEADEKECSSAPVRNRSSSGQAASNDRKSQDASANRERYYQFEDKEYTSTANVRTNKMCDSQFEDAKYASAAKYKMDTGSRRFEEMNDPYVRSTTNGFASSAGVDVWSSKFEPHDFDETLYEDVDRFMTAMEPIKECQRQVLALKSDRSRTKQEIAREAKFWRQHEAKWKTRLPFHSAENTYDTDTHFL